MSCAQAIRAGHRYHRCADDAPWTHHHYPHLHWCDAHKPEGSRTGGVLAPTPTLGHTVAALAVEPAVPGAGQLMLGGVL
jgi:hypothetical protein